MAADAAPAPAASLLEELPAFTMGHPLSPPYNIALHLLLPPAVGLLVYLIIITADITLVIMHDLNGNYVYSIATLCIIYLPAVSCYIYTISVPSLWPSKNMFSKENFKFFIIQTWSFLAFPIAVVVRYVSLIFWALEALFANLQSDRERQEEALRTLMLPSSLELYFFLQAYLHSVPQAMLQLYILIQEDVPKETANVQLLSMIVLLMRMASTTSKYQRFERRKVLGDCYPWSKKQIEKLTNRYILNGNYPTINDTSKHSSRSENEETRVPDNEDEEEETYENPISYQTCEIEVDRSVIVNDNFHSFERKVRFSAKERNYSETESEGEHFLEPIKRTDSPEPDIIQDPVIEFRKKHKEESRRKYRIEDMSQQITPPNTPAPRPSSLMVFREMIISNAEIFMDKIPTRKYKSHDVDLPVRVKRAAIKGLEQEDGIAKFVCIVSWFLFTTSRVVALTTFINFHPMEGAYICLAHYILATGALMWNSWRERVARRFFYFFLGYVYLFCLLEFKMKFRKVRIWYGLFFIIVSVENFLMTAVWFWTDSFSRWWFSYLALIISFGLFMSYMCFLVYNTILKPKTRVLYPTISRDCVFPVVMG